MVKLRKKNKKATGVSLHHGFKKTVSVLLSISLLSSLPALPGTPTLSKGILSPVNVSAAEKTINDNVDSATHYTYKVYIDTGSVQKAEITGYTGTDWNLIIPKTVTYNENQIPVGKIAKQAFSEDTNVTGLTIPEGLEIEIGEKAFYKCPNLKTVSLPSTVTWTIKDKTAPGKIHYGSNFEGCTALTDLSLGDGMTVLPDKVFQGCTSLKSVKLPSKLESFENCAFQDCTSLENLEIPEGVQEMGRAGFMNCTALKKVSIPSTIKRWCRSEHISYSNHAQIENDAFRNCTSLEEVNFAEGITNVGQYSFTGSSIKSVTIPSTVTELYYAFTDCDKLEEVILQEGDLKVIGIHAFYNCKALKNLDIPSSVTEIGEAAFGGCESLKQLIFPSNVVTFTGNSSCDENCSSLIRFYLLAEKLETAKANLYFNCPNIYCIEGSETYEACKEKMGGRVCPLTRDMITPALLDVALESYQGVYDSKAHPLVTVTGAREKEQLSYRILKKENQSEETFTKVPEVTEPGTYDIEVTLTRAGVKYIETVHAKISKKDAVIRLNDITVKEQEKWTVTPKEYTGEAGINFTYYLDKTLKKKCSGKPTTAGIYYVKATAKESAHYNAAESNVAKITILKKNTSKDPKVTVKKVSIKKVKSPSKKTMEIRWKKISKVSGYIIWIGQNKKFTKGKKVYTVKSNKKTKKIIRKLKRKKKYYVKIKAYRMVNGKKYQGAFSKVKTVKIK